MSGEEGGLKLARRGLQGAIVATNFCSPLKYVQEGSVIKKSKTRLKEDHRRCPARLCQQIPALQSPNLQPVGLGWRCRTHVQRHL